MFRNDWDWETEDILEKLFLSCSNNKLCYDFLGNNVEVFVDTTITSYEVCEVKCSYLLMVGIHRMVLYVCLSDFLSGWLFIYVTWFFNKEVFHCRFQGFDPFWINDICAWWPVLCLLYHFSIGFLYEINIHWFASWWSQ